MARAGPALLILLAALGVTTGGILRPCHCDVVELRQTARFEVADLGCCCCDLDDDRAPDRAPEGLKLCRTQPPAADAPGSPVALDAPDDAAPAPHARVAACPVLQAPVVEGADRARPEPPQWLHTIEGLTVLLI